LNYVDELAQAIRREVAPEVIPEGGADALFRTYAVLAMAKAREVKLEDVHNAWVAWMSDQNPDHHSLKPLAELPVEVQRLDQPFLDAIRWVAGERGLGSEKRLGP
jgi:hypothetical protein